MLTFSHIVAQNCVLIVGWRQRHDAGWPSAYC